MVEILSAVGGSVVAALIANYVWEKNLRDRLRVRRLKLQSSREVAGMLELYSALFPDEAQNYSGDHILSLLQDRFGRLKRKHTPCVDILLTAQTGRAVVGFLFCHYYPSSSHAVVSYCGRDEESEAARLQDAIGVLLKKLAAILRKEHPPCSLLLFEVADRRLRSVFRQRALQIGFQARELLINYRRPRYCLEATAEGDPLHLMCVALSGPATSGVFTRKIVVEILETLHLLGYGDYYDPSDPRHQKYQEYLRKRVESYRIRLSDPIQVS